MIGRLLDRYILGQWLKIFALTALGFPLVSIVINVTDSLNKLLDRGLTLHQIALSYVYSVPENMFLVMPAAVLFATVFTVGAMARHAELTAAKAGGQSFHRLILPLVIASIGAAALGIVVGELAPGSTAHELRIQKAQPQGAVSSRYNFVYRADEGWVYTIRSLDLASGRITGLLFERQGTGLEYPSLILTADSGTYDPEAHQWRLWDGASRAIAAPDRQAAYRFHTMQLRAFTQTPAELLAEAKAPDEMRYAELGRYIEALKRSGNDANKLVAEQALKLAIPVTCFIIAIFGAPLAITSPRAGTAFGIAVSLATTVLFLLLMQIAKAVGAGGLIDPVAAAWIPNAAFLLIGLGLLVRART
ncbi:MAG TPA: LptF/LptG family permease [Gemmatimonadales bacterium]|nr:LptF/LptG family permease [Gemmatimonadales bacterium]